MKDSQAAARKLRQVALSGVVGLAALVGFTGAALADTTVKVYRSHMPDGSVVLGDRPAAGARNVESSSYSVAAPRQGGASAEAEREYWRRQAEAFDQRQARRDAMQSRRSQSSWNRHGALGQGVDQGNWAYAGYAGRPLVPLNRVDPVYRSSPGAVRGRQSGFIGSGFSTAR